MKKINLNTKLNNKQKVIVGLTSVLIITGGFYGVTQISKYTQEQKLMESRVDIYEIPGREKIFINGKILPLKSEELYINAEQGELSTIKVEDKSYVEKGAPLFTCKNSAQVKEIEALKEQISIKNKEKQNAMDEESKIAINEEIKQLNKQINDLNKTAYSTVYAPFSGKVYITEKQGDGKPVMVLETTDFYVKGQVNERDSYKISLNQGVEIKTIATNNKYSGKITEIGDRPIEGEELSQSYSMDSSMAQYLVKISLESQENLKNGLNVQIVALNGSTDKMIPNVSIEQDGNKYYVYKIQNDIAYKTEVKIKENKDDYFLVEDGVLEGDKIIKDIQGRDIKDGDKVYTGQALD